MQAAGVGQQHIDRDDVAVGQLRRQIGKPLAQQIGSRQHPFLLKLEEDGGGHHLGVAADLVGRVGRQRLAGGHVRDPGGLEVATFGRDDQHRSAGPRSRDGLHQARQDLVELSADRGIERVIDRVDGQRLLAAQINDRGEHGVEEHGAAIGFQGNVKLATHGEHLGRIA